MADDKQTTTDLVNKVVESFGLLHNDLEEVKNILVKNGIQSTGTTSQLAAEVTKLPEKTEETIKKSGEVKGLANGILDITGGFTYAPNSTTALNETNCLVNNKNKEFTLPKGKDLEMYFPTDSLVNNILTTETSADKRNLVLNVSDKQFLQDSYAYLTGAKDIGDISFTVNINDQSLTKVNYNGKQYVNFPKEGDNDRPGVSVFTGKIGFADYNTKFTVNGEVLENVKCDTFTLTPNKYVKEVVCNNLNIDYYALMNILYKYNKVVSAYETGEETPNFDPIIIKVINEITDVENISKSLDYRYKRPAFLDDVDPLNNSSLFSDEELKYAAFEKAKNIIGLSHTPAEFLSRMCHILVDPAKINLTRSIKPLLMRLPLYNLDNTKKYNYSNRTWEEVSKATEDASRYFNITSSGEFDADNGQLIGIDKSVKIRHGLAKIDRNPETRDKGIIVLQDLDNNDYITKKNSYFTETPDNRYIIKNKALVETPFGSNNNYFLNSIKFEFESAQNVGSSYPFHDLDFSSDVLEVKFGNDINTDSEYVNLRGYARTMPGPVNTKFKSYDNKDITKLDMTSHDEGCPLFFNKYITEVKVNKIIIPYKAKSFRRLIFGKISDAGFTKFIFADTPSIVESLPWSLSYYRDNLSEYDYDFADFGVYNHTGYRFDCTQQEAINNFVSHIHCHIRSNNSILQNKNFLKYRLPLFTLDGNQRFNYSLRQWQLIGQYDPKNDNKPMTQIFPELAEELNKMRVIGSKNV